MWVGPRGRALKRAVSQSLDHLTSVFDVGASPVLATYETSQVLLVGVPPPGEIVSFGVSPVNYSGVFRGVLPFSPHLLIGPSHMM